MDNLPPYIPITFLCCVIATFAFLHYATSKASHPSSNGPVFLVTFFGIWVFLIAVLSYQGFFSDYNAFPPWFFLGPILMLGLIVALFGFRYTRGFLLTMPITTLTYLHIIRVPVEIVLWWLYIEGAVDQSLTFEGSNLDILSGISAPFAGLFLVGMKSKSKMAALIWNVLCLGLLLNILIRAVLSTPYFFNPRFFDLPNIAVFEFPYILLPFFVVPAVLFAHLVSIYQLVALKDEED